MPQTETALFYQLYFQEPGVAEAELERDPRDTIRRLLFSASGDAPLRAESALAPEAVGMVPRSGGFLTRMIDPERLPPWLTEADVDFYADEFARTGFRGGLNWYRNIDRNWELMAPFASLKVDGPRALCGGRSRPRRRLPRRGQAHREPEDVRSRAPRHDHAARLRPLDAAGAPRRGQRGDPRVSQGAGVSSNSHAANCGGNTDTITKENGTFHYVGYRGYEAQGKY